MKLSLLMAPLVLLVSCKTTSRDSGANLTAVKSVKGACALYGSNTSETLLDKQDCKANIEAEKCKMENLSKIFTSISRVMNKELKFYANSSCSDRQVAIRITKQAPAAEGEVLDGPGTGCCVRYVRNSPSADWIADGCNDRQPYQVCGFIQRPDQERILFRNNTRAIFKGVLWWRQCNCAEALYEPTISGDQGSDINQN